MATLVQDPKVNYTKFAELLSSAPGEVSLLRFRALHIRNLLFYQAEILDLQHQLQQIEDADALSKPDPRQRVNFRWTIDMAGRETGTHATSNGPTSTAQTPIVTLSDAYISKMKQIRSTLALYDQALEQYQRLEQLPSPSRKQVEGIGKWLDRRDFGGAFLSGDPQHVWDATYNPDEFLTFETTGGIAAIIARSFISVRARLFSSSTRTYHIDGSDDAGLTQGISVVVSSILPVLPIVVLNFVKNVPLRIGLILIFTAVFAAVLVFGLGLPPEKVLTITTAIAAVQVVYVGSSNTT